ncbi:unnamed protein product [Alopecurus aequalis]
MEQEAAARSPERGTEATLRPFQLADADTMAAWASDPVVMPAASPTSTWWPYPNPSRNALLAFLLDTALPHPWLRAVCLPDDTVVGAVSVTPTDDRCRAEVGIALARAHWGGCVAAAALRRAAVAAFGELEGVERVEALVDADDAAGRGALEDAGFRLEAVLRSYRVVEGRLTDTAVYSLISTDPLD